MDVLRCLDAPHHKLPSRKVPYNLLLSISKASQKPLFILYLFKLFINHDLLIQLLKLECPHQLTQMPNLALLLLEIGEIRTLLQDVSIVGRLCSPTAQLTMELNQSRPLPPEAVGSFVSSQSKSDSIAATVSIWPLLIFLMSLAISSPR